MAAQQLRLRSCCGVARQRTRSTRRQSNLWRGWHYELFALLNGSALRFRFPVSDAIKADLPRHGSTPDFPVECHTMPERNLARAGVRHREQKRTTLPSRSDAIAETVNIRRLFCGECVLMITTMKLAILTLALGVGVAATRTRAANSAQIPSTKTVYSFAPPQKAMKSAGSSDFHNAGDAVLMCNPRTSCGCTVPASSPTY